MIDLTNKKVLIIPDLHQHVGRAKNAIDKAPSFDYLVFMGDYFDCFEKPDGIDTYGVEATCEWLNELVGEYKDKVIFIAGNHDISYMEAYGRKYTGNLYHTCSGFTDTKAKKITKCLPRSFFTNLQLAVKIDNFIISHAGFQPYHFKPNYSELENVKLLCDEWDERKWDLIFDCYFKFAEAGIENGGDYGLGSPLWIRWHNIQPLETLNLIVGHTEHSEVQFKRSKMFAINLDTNLKDCMFFENNKFTIIQTNK